VDVQDQVAGPNGKRAKFSHGPCDNRHAGFNVDPQFIAVAEEMLFLWGATPCIKDRPRPKVRRNKVASFLPAKLGQTVAEDTIFFR
jgi:hypothetical protein